MSLVTVEVRVLDEVGREQASFRIEDVKCKLRPVGIVATLDHFLRKLFKENPDFEIGVNNADPSS